MLDSAKEIIAELESTLIEIIETTAVLQQKADCLSEEEISFLEKVQASLTHRFSHVCAHAPAHLLRQKKIEELLQTLQELSPELRADIHCERTHPRIGRNRKKTKQPVLVPCHF